MNAQSMWQCDVVTKRVHQGVDNVPLTDLPEPDDDVPKPKDLRCQQWLGGLLKSYHRKAA